MRGDDIYRERTKEGVILTAMYTIYIIFYNILFLYTYECLCSRSPPERRAPPPTRTRSVSCFCRFCSVTIYFSFLFSVYSLRVPAIPCNNNIMYTFLLLYAVYHYSLPQHYIKIDFENKNEIF